MPLNGLLFLCPCACALSYRLPLASVSKPHFRARDFVSEAPAPPETVCQPSLVVDLSELGACLAGSTGQETRSWTYGGWRRKVVRAHLKNLGGFELLFWKSPPWPG